MKSNDGGGGGYGTRISVKVMTGEGGNSARPAVMLQMSLLSCVFLVLYGSSGSYGRDRSVCDTIHAG